MQDITQALQGAIKELFNTDIPPELTRPDEQFGDYTINAALRLANQLGQPPRDIATQLAEKLRHILDDRVKDITIAGPGFINITLNDSSLLETAKQAPISKPQLHAGKVILTEYSDPNPFKVLHAGHLYTTLVGDAISRLLEAAGGEVHRVNFGGDVGLHVAKNMWAIIQYLGGENPAKLQAVGDDPHVRAAWLSSRYVEGNTAYEDDEAAKLEITSINKRIYQLHADNDRQSDLAQIYWTCREWSYAYFKVLYDELQVKPFEKYYPESQTTPIGMQTVATQLANGVYTKSNGAVVFEGEKYGLHTRVFINSQGLPTYEAKDVGLIMQKWQDYHFDLSLIITANDIVEYMKVVQKSIEQFTPDLTKRSVHLTHGNLKLQGGRKMSSRKGNVLLALDVLEAATQANRQFTGQDNRQTMLGAVKYAFLKQRIGGDIVYNPQESVSTEGNSGPYLQYAHARACSILAKAAGQPEIFPDQLVTGERSLVRKIGEYPEIFQKAVQEYMPHHICGYLYELAQAFNRFYEHNRVIGDERQAERLALVRLYAAVLKDGLALLGIEAPERL